MRRALLAAGLVLAAGCDVPDPHPREHAPIARPPIDAGPLRLVSATLEGKLSLGAAPKGGVLVAVTDGPCFAAGTHYLGLAAPARGSWRAQVFAPEGTLLQACAAVLPGGQRKTPWIGRSAGEVRAVGSAPIVARGLLLEVKREAQPVEVPAALGARASDF